MHLRELDASMVVLFKRLMEMYAADPKSVDPSVIEQAVAYVAHTKKIKLARRVASNGRNGGKAPIDPFAQFAPTARQYKD